MFEPTSRYYTLETATLNTKAGASLAYVRRRFLPPLGISPLLGEVTTAEGDRLDLIASRILGDPEQFWRICDENPAMNPTDLTAEVGTMVRVPVPGAWRPR